MIRVEIKVGEAVTKSGTSAKTGKPYSIREQMAYALFCDRNGVAKSYPSEVKIPLDDHQAPYAPGMYTLADASFFPGKFQEFQVRPVLMPLAVSSKLAA